MPLYHHEEEEEKKQRRREVRRREEEEAACVCVCVFHMALDKNCRPLVPLKALDMKSRLSAAVSCDQSRLHCFSVRRSGTTQLMGVKKQILS